MSDKEQVEMMEREFKKLLPRYTASPSFSLELFQRFCHASAKSKGFWDGPMFESSNSAIPIKLALIVSEVGEAIDAHRSSAMDSHLPNVEGLVAELADIQIRVWDLAGRYSMPLAEVILKKLEYNLTRGRMHGKKY